MDSPRETNSMYLKFAVVLVIAIAAILAVVYGRSAQAAIYTSAAVQLPVAVKTAIEVGIVALLTAGFAWLFKVFGLDLRGMVPVISLAISSFVVTELQNIINLIPVQFDPFVNTFLYFLVLVLTPAGALWLLNKDKEGNSTASLL